MSSNTVTVQSRVTPEIKSEADALLKSIGLNSSSFVRLALTALVRNREIPHGLLEIPNAETAAAIHEIEEGTTSRLPAGGFRELAKRAR